MKTFEPSLKARAAASLGRMDLLISEVEEHVKDLKAELVGAKRELDVAAEAIALLGQGHVEFSDKINELQAMPKLTNEWSKRYCDLLEENESLRLELAKERECVDFYANRDNWETIHDTRDTLKYYKDIFKRQAERKDIK